MFNFICDGYKYGLTPDRQILKQSFYCINDEDVKFIPFSMRLRRINREISFEADGYWYTESLIGVCIWQVLHLLKKPYWKFLRFLWKRHFFYIEPGSRFSWTGVNWFWQRKYKEVK